MARSYNRNRRDKSRAQFGAVWGWRALVALSKAADVLYRVLGESLGKIAEWLAVVVPQAKQLTDHYREQYALTDGHDNEDELPHGA